MRSSGFDPLKLVVLALKLVDVLALKLAVLALKLVLVLARHVVVRVQLVVLETHDLLPTMADVLLAIDLRQDFVLQIVTVGDP